MSPKLLSQKTPIQCKILQKKILNFRYLEGSNAIAKIDLEKRFGNYKAPKHYKEWYTKWKNDEITSEVDLWVTGQSMEIVRKFVKGEYSMNQKLASEKLVFEVINGLRLS